MIFPFWLHREHFLKAPVTLMILGLNVFFFLVFPLKNGPDFPMRLAQKVSHRDYIAVQSYLYENYLKRKQEKEWTYWTRQFFQHPSNHSVTELEDFWFQLSFRDGTFLKIAPTLPEFPDPLRYKAWKKVYEDVEQNQKQDISGLFGVSIYGHTWSHYITYQFIHAGFLHLISNMVILLLFGILIEVQAGSWVLLGLYLWGGIFGALFYNWTSGNNSAPLIGASGSVSALIMFYLVTEARRNLKFFYFFFPSLDFYGEVYLSKWWLIPLLLLGDVNALLNTPGWDLSVAHTAHLGALLLGGVIAGFYVLIPKSTTRPSTGYKLR